MLLQRHRQKPEVLFEARQSLAQAALLWSQPLLRQPFPSREHRDFSTLRPPTKPPRRRHRMGQVALTLAASRACGTCTRRNNRPRLPSRCPRLPSQTTIRSAKANPNYLVLRSYLELPSFLLPQKPSPVRPLRALPPQISCITQHHRIWLCRRHCEPGVCVHRHRVMYHQVQLSYPMHLRRGQRSES